MPKRRLVAWSDIHYHNYPSGITADDIDSVEQQIEDYALAHEVDFYLFAGDRFQARNPADKVKVKSDYAMSRRAKVLKMPGIIVAGNHDYDDVSIKSGNTYRVVDAFPDLFPRLLVADKVATYKVLPDVLIHALPAGALFDIKNYQIDRTCLNVLVFHGLLKGAAFDAGGECRIRDGYSLADIDRPEFDLVLGGDVHVPQDFTLMHTTGCYIGSSLQLNIGDAGSPRGFLDITLEKGRKPVIVLVPSRAPQFYRANLSVLDLDSAMAGWQEAVKAGKATFDDCIIHVTLTGPETVLATFDTDVLSEQLKTLGAVRSVKVTKQLEIVIDTRLPDLETETDTPLKDPELYVMSGKIDLEGLKPDRLVQLGQQLIAQAMQE